MSTVVVDFKFLRGVDMSNLIKVRRKSSTCNTRNVKFTLWNACSVDKKLHVVSDSIIQNCTDVFLLTETWFKDDDNSIAARLASMITGYKIYH